MNKAGLLPVGVVDVEGSFAQQESVRIVAVERPLDGRPSDRHGLDVGRALVNYSSTEIARIKGHQSKEVKDLLGYADSEYVAERENISFFRRESRPQTPIRDLEPLVHGITEYESHA